MKIPITIHRPAHDPELLDEYPYGLCSRLCRYHDSEYTRCALFGTLIVVIYRDWDRIWERTPECLSLKAGPMDVEVEIDETKEQA